jgi:hypothetical protein
MSFCVFGYAWFVTLTLATSMQYHKLTSDGTTRKNKHLNESLMGILLEHFIMISLPMFAFQLAVR